MGRNIKIIETMNIIKRQELPLFGDMMNHLLDDRFFEPIKKYATLKVPSVNIFEQEDGFAIQMAVPGMKKEDFNIEIEGNGLSVSAQSKKEEKSTKENYSTREFNFSSFKRSFTLPKRADRKNIEAKYIDGILE